MQRIQKKYDSNFKLKAIQLSYERGNIAQAERELGLPLSLLCTWRSKYQKFGAASFCGSGHSRLSEEQQLIKKLESDLRYLELIYEILRKENISIFQNRQLLYQFIESNKKICPIITMCKVLGISRKAYQDSRKQVVPKNQSHVDLIKSEIKNIFFENKQRYGSPRITVELKERGFKVCSKRVIQYMQQLGLRSITKKKKNIKNSSFNSYVVSDILKQEIELNDFSQVWISAITYIKTSAKYFYLTIIMDLRSKIILGWNLSSGLKSKQTSLAAWKMAISNRKIADGLIFHSYRGVQYANKKFAKTLDSYKSIKRSMTLKKEGQNNTFIQTFIDQLKKEFKNKSLSKNEMRAKIAINIEAWNNK